ncbi:Ig-like domain-containing protein, partial [Fulvivirga aurantia]|uniref:Ig-like domain-containing protein n=1 Tax=Fulvivirga aurantia TaxID=2529383 RepID=UPI00162AE537
MEKDFTKVLTRLAIRSILCIFLFSISSLFSAHAEGTKELQPQGENANGSLCALNLDGNSNWGTYSASADERIFISIKSPGERIYFGFGIIYEGIDNPNFPIQITRNFRIRRASDNAIVYSGTTPTSGSGFINDYSEAVAGPSTLVGGSGYNPLSFSPGQVGDYYIEFQNYSTSYTIKYFDVTVADGINIQTGRLWSKLWELTMMEFGAGGASPNGRAETKFYAYTADSVVTTLDLNGMRPYLFTVLCNKSGVTAVGNFEESRKSVNFRSVFAEYPLFLNNPDEDLFPSGEPAFLTSQPRIVGCPSQQFDVVFSTNKIAYAEILIDLDGNPGPNYGTQDVIIVDYLVPGKNIIPWDGNDGFGVPVPEGTTFSARVSIISGLTNFPIYDAEYNEAGFIVGLERPAGTEPLIYWDDSNIGEATPPDDVNLDGRPSPNHGWTNTNYGNLNTINSWWFTYSLQKSFTYEVVANCTPNPTDDNYTTDEDVAFSGNLTTNDNDPDAGDVITVSTTPLSGPKNGSVVISPDGTFTYTPKAEFSGSDSFTYEVCDDGDPTLCDNATVSFTVNPINDGPVALKDSDNTSINTATSGNVLSNDYDKEGSPLTVNTSPVTPPSNGVLILNANGTYTYTPNNGFTGIDTFEYQVCDDGAPNASVACSVATVTITVGSGNKAPVANNDTGTTNENTTLSANVITNDSDPEGDNLTVSTTPVSGPGNGTLVLNADGSYDYTPSTGFFGTDVFSYQVCDDGTPSQCSEATVTITVNEVDLAPVAVDDSFTGPIDTAISGNLFENDSELDGQSLTLNTAYASGLTGVGTLYLYDNGTFLYEPGTGETGIVTFDYQVCDPGNNCSVATVTMNIGAANNPPVAQDDNPIVNEDATLNGVVYNNDSEPDGENLSFSLVGAPPAGTAFTFNPDGTYSYTPTANFNGTVSFTYQACDDNVSSLCDNAVVTITVSPVNDAPVASADPTETVDEDNTLNSTLTDLVTDIDDTPANLTYSLSNGSTAAANGTLVINTDGTYSYTPNTNFNGSVNFEYQVCDDGSPALCDTEFVTIQVNAINDGPVAVDDTQSVLQDVNATGNVISNDSDPEGNALTVSSPGTFNFPGEGTLTIAANGAYTFDPEPAFLGTFTYTYTVCDTEPLCANADLTVNVNATGNPIAVDDVTDANQDQTVSGNVLANDSDPEGDVLNVDNPGTYNTPEGTLTITALGGYTFNPVATFVGTFTFTYTVCDNLILPANCSDADIIINYQAAPIAVDDNASTNQGTPISGNVITNDSDPEGDLPLTIQSPGTYFTTDGTITIYANGGYTYEPDAPNTSGDSYVYTVCDSKGACSNATLNININAVPNAGNDSETVLEDGSITAADVTANDSDPDDVAANLTYSLFDGGSAAANGTLTFNETTGTFDYVPDANFFGTVTFQYQLCDDESPAPGCDIATVTITVDPVNDAPTASDLFETGTENVTFNGDVANGASDVDDVAGDLSYSVVGGTAPNPGTEGTLSMNADGTYSFIPVGGFTGTVNFDYQVCDDETPTNACAIATVTLTINPGGGNAAPVAGQDFFNVDEDGFLSADVSTNDGDPDDLASALSYTLLDGATAATNGTLNLLADGSFTYTPNPNFNGDVTFVYQVCDDETPTAACDNATVTITVNNINDLPATNNDSNSINEDVFSITDADGSGKLLSNDTDADGDGLTVVSVDANSSGTVFGNYGTLFWSADGSYTYELDNSNATVQALGVGQTLTETFTYVASDGNGGNVPADLAITINGVNDTPVANDATVSLDENSANGTTVHTVVATDNDNDIVDYAIIAGNTGGAFTINNTTGEITVANSTALDFESNPTFTLTVEVTDNDGLTDTATITINLNDLDEVVPTVDIQGAPAIVNNTAAYNVTFEFSEDVTGFTIGDIVVGNGSASNFVAVDGNTYTADITPSGTGNITIDVPANVAQD